MRKIKIAQIGASLYSHGAEIFATLTKNLDCFEVLGYALPEREEEKYPHRLKSFEGYKKMTVEEILNNPEIEAVAVETEEQYLCKYAIMAAEAGKHIHMEKPGGMKLSEFSRLIEICKEKNLVFHTGYMYRYNPVVSALFERIENGELGEIISVEAQMSGKHSDAQREWMNSFENSGMMFFLGCHLVDLVYRIMGKPKRVIPFIKETLANGVKSPDFALALFEYDRGVSFVKTTDMEYGGFIRRQLVVTGTKGTVEIKPLEIHPDKSLVTDETEPQITEYTDHLDSAWGARGERHTSPVYDRYKNMMRSFSLEISGDLVSPYSKEYELELYKLVLESCSIKYE